jgi:hypothetical protein
MVLTPKKNHWLARNTFATPLQDEKRDFAPSSLTVGASQWGFGHHSWFFLIEPFSTSQPKGSLH